MLHTRLGQLLLDAGCVTAAQLREALAQQQETRQPLGQILCERQVISEETLLKFLGQQYGLATAYPFPSDVAPQLANCVPQAWARQHVAVPVNQAGRRLTVALADPANLHVLDEVRFRTGLQVIPVVALESDIRQCLQALYQGQDDGRHDGSSAPANTYDAAAPARAASHSNEGESRAHTVDSILQSEEMTSLLDKASSSLRYAQPEAGTEAVVEEESPVARLVQTILERAAGTGVSDVHLEPDEGGVRVRFRLDGVLHTAMTYSLGLRNAVISRLKILSHLDIAERRLPQDGRMTLELGGQRIVDARLSVLPSLHGEKAVLRLLNRAGQLVELAALGLDATDTETFLTALERPHGMILVTGPTGSGKTTTLYAALQALNTPDVNIVTVEDPVEYHFTGITQVQIKEEIGLGFARILRAFLRQDPDIMMVGEIRDLETAQIAIRAALTGHRVLSTLHTHDAVRAVTRLLDMGVEPFMVASSVSVIVAQRLVRRICPDCQRPDDRFSIQQLREAGFTCAEVTSIAPMRGQGCVACHGTGYKGRIGLFEVLPVSDQFRSRVLERQTAEQLKQQALADGLKTIRRSGLDKIKQGLTTMEEVVSVSTED
ncbi:MAG: ATPase, T2SS/T4P/T4SS family [Nitrospira sp.]|nr:ATPase, T2SS/T4P/T4SS family [Nitrospira sp.]MDE0406178.1 ATPase, T2SS/T4P/T4SS family [Nitrospira sp.]MDE0485947.1 ATPase, T2SS/T4P/T4SS family [Nitrospira sp.]